MATFYNNLNGDETSLKLIQDSIAEENIFEDNVSCSSGVSVDTIGDTAYYFARTDSNIIKQKAGGRLTVNNAGLKRKSIDMSNALVFCEEVRKSGIYSVDPVADRIRSNIKKAIVGYNDEALKYLSENGYNYDTQYTAITADNAYSSIVNALKDYKVTHASDGLEANCIIVSNTIGAYLLLDSRFIKLQPTVEEVRKHNHLIGRINNCLVFSADLGLEAWDNHEYVDFIVYNSNMFVAPLNVWNLSRQEGTLSGYPNSEIIGGELRYGFAIEGSDEYNSNGVFVKWNTELVNLSWGKSASIGNNIKVYLKKGSGASATYTELSGSSATIAKGAKVKVSVLKDENEKAYVSGFDYTINEGEEQTVTASVPSLVSVESSDITISNNSEIEVTSVESIDYYTITITNQAAAGFVYDITSTCVTYPTLGFEVTVPTGIETDDLANAKIIHGSDVRFTVKYDASTQAGSFTYALNDDVETEVSGNAALFEFGEHVPSITDDNVLPFKLLEVTEPSAQTLTPFAVNDVLVDGDKIYFDTSVNVETLFASVSTEELLLQGKCYEGETEGSNAQMMMVAADGAGGFIIGFCPNGDTPVFVYSTSANPELGVDAGWQNLASDDSISIDFSDTDLTSIKITNVSSNVSGWNGVIVGTQD